MRNFVDQFKSYEDLKKRLDYVLGLTVAPKKQDPEVIDEDNNLEDLSEGRDVVDTTPSSVNTDEDEEDASAHFCKISKKQKIPRKEFRAFLEVGSDLFFMAKLCVDSRFF